MRCSSSAGRLIRRHASQPEVCRSKNFAFELSSEGSLESSTLSSATISSEISPELSSEKCSHKSVNDASRS